MCDNMVDTSGSVMRPLGSTVHTVEASGMDRQSRSTHITGRTGFNSDPGPNVAKHFIFLLHCELSLCLTHQLAPDRDKLPPINPSGHPYIPTESNTSLPLKHTTKHSSSRHSGPLSPLCHDEQQSGSPLILSHISPPAPAPSSISSKTHVQIFKSHQCPSY
jgi:hypothetical protein